MYLFNSPILTSYGEWRFSGPMDNNQVRELLAKGFTSAIGHPATAEFLSAILAIDVPVNRIRAQLTVGEQAVVVRLLTRLPAGKVLSVEEMKQIPHEFGLLTRRT